MLVSWSFRLNSLRKMSKKGRGVGMRNIRVRMFPQVQIRRAQRCVVDMQLIRLKLIKDLQVVFDMAKGFAQRKDGKSKNDKITVKQRQGWVSIMVYTGQVMNSITKSFDEAQVTKDLERLEKMINEAMATEKNRAVDPAS